MVRYTMQRKLYEEEQEKKNVVKQPSGRETEKMCYFCCVRGKRYPDAVIETCVLCHRNICTIDHAYPLESGKVRCLDTKECQRNRKS